MRFFINSLLMVLAIGSLEGLANEYPVITQNETEFFSISVKDLELSLPLKLKNIIKVQNSGSVYFAGTDNFMIEYTSFDTTSGKEETKHFAADIQTTAAPCNANERKQNLNKTFEPNSGRDISLNDVTNENFDGYYYFAEDYKHPDKNIIIGAANALNSECYSTSLAVYGVGNMKEPAFRRIVKELVDTIECSYQGLTKNQ